MDMKKSELKQLIQEIVKESMFSKQNPDGGVFGGGVPSVWNNSKEVEATKGLLDKALDAGNFDMAHKLVDKLSHLHN